ncbi:hypothetical protein Skr01_61900 [Sphaerisporangium krabiense]|uniref:Potassium transporter TrkA n=1 Tax=Sphaerisporangium krabiense TaxID=763782 RepID=A0A7W9DPC4_9ACTN|nr:potassium transporter TrkA [Sphaerisporangium krabiense]MBB5626228.1 hypothetical protein [Sphaerisporangium krabiense]GII66105.1 hypothetical protein Skr01_61900 [Sphaerisporangium krabiense]
MTTRMAIDENDGRATLAVIGTGGLARAVCYALAEGGRPLRVLVIGRDPRRTAEVSYIGSVKTLGTPVTFEPVTVDLAADGALAEVLAAARPTGVLVLASPQSPWERLNAPSDWTRLVQRAGFGLTLPFQARFARQAAEALARFRPSAWLVNGCLPDAVNPVLAGLGVPPLCGIGNVALVASALQAALGVPERARLKVLAHHLHLHSPPPNAEEALAWADGRPVTGVGALLDAMRSVSRPELNLLTGQAAARLVGDVLEGRDAHANLPGPLGLPGGYPVRIFRPHPDEPVRAELSLPDGVSESEAVAFNERAARHDGVAVEHGRVVFTRVRPGDLPAELADGFPVGDLDEATRCLSRFRDRLRGDT